MEPMQRSDILREIPFRDSTNKIRPRRKRQSFLQEYQNEIDHFCTQRAQHPGSQKYSIRSLARSIQRREKGKRKVSHTTVLRYLIKIGFAAVWSEK